ncbi:MAG: three-Cys-motif partner protein TcmP [Sandaracinaceae bacterium]|nr:three-Cys-motif partner protein TcmP [Sandaracinaceae bacterium]
MGDKLPVIWPYEPHTAAKHAILRAYLSAWFPILASIKRAKRVLFLDGFAGPGEYTKGEPGSPAIAIQIALQHRAQFRVPVRLAFIEADKDRHAHLCRVVERLRTGAAATSNQIDIRPPILGDCATHLAATLDAYAKRGGEFGPALVFLDQFGYSDVPMPLIARVLVQPRCEVFTYIHAEGMTRFLKKAEIHGAVSDAFGSDDWKRALTVPQGERAKVLAHEYERALRERAGARYVWRFAMHGADDTLLYWLFFCTNDRLGLEKMKSAMNDVDTSGGYFSFSDARSPDQAIMFSRCTPEWLAEHLTTHFAGREVSVDAIEEHVLVATPLVKCRGVLGGLERAGKITAINPPKGRRKAAFNHPGMLLRFENRGLG